jgi:ATP-dependent Clp protease ATP-binding subunit ClpA
MLGYKNDLPYSFLFVGKSGVGKTMLVKEYSKFLNIPFIRLDMSEYKEAHTISKIIGSPPGYVGYNDVDNVLEKVKNNPFSIVLLDEIEKACNEVINLFLQILDEGIITDSHGNKISFKNTIIIMTSNVGSDKEDIGFNNNGKSDKELQNILSTPFVNRINKVLYFKNLEKEDIYAILASKLKEIKDKYKRNNIKIHMSKKVLDDIVNNSKYENFGARNASKLLEDKIDEIVIDGILAGKSSVYVKN